MAHVAPIHIAKLPLFSAFPDILSFVQENLSSFFLTIEHTLKKKRAKQNSLSSKQEKCCLSQALMLYFIKILLKYYLLHRELLMKKLYILETLLYELTT